MKKSIKNAAKWMVLAVSVIFITLTVAACRENNQDTNGDLSGIEPPSTGTDTMGPSIVDDGPMPIFSITDIELFPYNFRSSQSIGRTSLSGNAVLIPRIARGYRFSQELIGEGGDPLMGHSSNWEYWEMAPPSEFLGPHGERLRVGQDIEYGVDFFSYLDFDLFAMDIDNPETNTIVWGIPLDFDTVSTRILAVDVDDAGFVSLLTAQRNHYDEHTIYLHRIDGDDIISEHIIDQTTLGGRNVFVDEGWFTADGSFLLNIITAGSVDYELLLLDGTGTNILARFDTAIWTSVTGGSDGRLWRAIEGGGYTAIHALDQSELTWVDEIRVPVTRVLGLHAAPRSSDFAWFIHTEDALYGITENGDAVRYIIWADTGVSITDFTEIHIVDDSNILVLEQAPHPWQEGAVMLSTYLLYRTDVIDERAILTVGGVDIRCRNLTEIIRLFNMESTTHRAVLVDYADDGWIGSIDRLRVELITGDGPDVIIFNQWGDENDLTHSLMRGGFLADLRGFLDNDPVLSYEDFFTNIFDIWTNNNDELFLVAGAVTPTPFWGPSELLDDFTDFTHEGFLNFLRNAEASGVSYPAGLNFLPNVILGTMLFADDTFFCFETDKADFDNALFIDILTYANNIDEFQQALWTAGLQTGEALNPIPFMARGEQLMSNLFGFTTVGDFRSFDFAVGGMTPIGSPNAAGELAISTRPVSRMGIRANSPNAEAAWELIRLELLHPNIIDRGGIPTKRAIFEAYIDSEIGAVAGDFFGVGEDAPPFTRERAAVLRLIMESITHEQHPDPHIMNIIQEDTAPIFAGSRSAEDAARIIQSRVSIYISERAG